MSRAEFYRLTSAAIRRAIEMRVHPPSAGDIVEELIHTFAQHNQKFDADRFRRDAGVL